MSIFGIRTPERMGRVGAYGTGWDDLIHTKELINECELKCVLPGGV